MSEVSSPTPPGHTDSMLRLRPPVQTDLDLLTGGDSPSAEFGARSARTAPAPADLADALTVLSDDGRVIGDVGRIGTGGVPLRHPVTR
jgi:hypothetical protein